MSFSVIPPPKEDAQITEAGKEIVQSAHRLGLKLDTEGFVMSWITGTRVLAERNANGEIVSLAFLVSGVRWTSSEQTASVLDYVGNEQAILDFAKTISQALGVHSFIYEEKEKFDETSQGCRRTIREIYLG